MRNHQTIFRCIKGKGCFNSDKALIKYSTIKPSDNIDGLTSLVNSIGLKYADIDWANTKMILKQKNGGLIKLDKNRDNGYEATYPFEDVWNTGDYDTLNSILIQSFTNEKVDRAQELTQKPELLLKRIVEISTNEKEVVMDFFSGSATTITTAHKLKRKWVGVEMGDYIYNTIIPRLKEALCAKSKREPTGITNDVNWQGGGFFKYFALEQYEDTLRQMSYRNNTPSDIFNTEKPYAGYIFLADEKLIDKVIINDDIDTLDFDKLYKGIDLPETISHLYGLPIKRITKTEVVLDGISKEIIINYDYKTMSKEDKVKFLKMLQPYIWWRQ